MNDAEIRRRPASLTGIVADPAAMSFNMISEPRVGALLAAIDTDEHIVEVTRRHLGSDSRTT